MTFKINTRYAADIDRFETHSNSIEFFITENGRPVITADGEIQIFVGYPAATDAADMMANGYTPYETGSVMARFPRS